MTATRYSPKIEEMLTDILRKEGGFVNHPNDTGGATNFGITIGTYSVWLGRPASVEEVRQMNVETAKEIYVRNYFEGPAIHTLPVAIQPIVFDGAVLFGPRQSIKFVQNVVNLAGFGPVDADGIIGPDTRKKVETAYKEMGGFFINAVVEERIAYHEMRVAQNPSQGIFLLGWKNRANSFRVEV